MVNAKQTVTIQDVAREAGVSTATVSRVLNGASTVAPELAKRVREAATRTRYVPNSTGRALRRQVADVWAAIVTDVQNPFFTAMVTAFESVALRQGVSVMLFNTDEQLDRERLYLEAAVGHRIAGAVVAVASESESDLSPLLEARIPVVIVDRRLHDYGGDSILVDNVEAGRLAARHLMQHGFRRIACIAGPERVSTTEDRLSGFKAALAEAGRPLAPDLVVRANLRAEGGEVAVRNLLGSAAPPDVIFATNGPLTVGAYRGTSALGWQIPQQVGLLGVDDDQWTRMVSPQVSVIQQPVVEMGNLAGELLTARAIDKTAPAQAIVLRPTLLVRSSTAPRSVAS